MHIQITARQCDLSEQIREKARTVVERWPRFDGTVSGARLVFEIRGQTHVVEVQVSRDRQEPVVASGDGGDFRAALDEVDSRVSRMLRRDKKRRKDHQAPPVDQID